MTSMIFSIVAVPLAKTISCWDPATCLFSTLNSSLSW
jgi:hypothetical protein